MANHRNHRTYTEHVQSLTAMLNELGKNNSTIEEYFNFEYSGNLEQWSAILKEVKAELNLPKLMGY